MAHTTVVPPGGLILVTGVNGFLGSHIANMLLERGYAVRGTVRSAEKAAWVQEAFAVNHPSAKFETVVIPDFGTSKAFDEHLKGCDGIAYVAGDLSFSPDPNKIITPMVEGVRNILQSAAKEPSIKRFVITSSAIAAVQPQPNTEIYVDSNKWNDDSIERAWRPPPYEQERMWDVYAASKAQVEHEFWNQGGEAAANLCNEFRSTGKWIKELFEYPERYEPLKNFIPRWFVDVKDTALLHIAALTEEDVKNERLFGYAEPFNFNSWVGAFRKIDPTKSWPADDPEQGRDIMKIDNRRAEGLLKRYVQDGWTPFFESVKRNCLDSATDWRLEDHVKL